MIAMLRNGLICRCILSQQLASIRLLDVDDRLLSAWLAADPSKDVTGVVRIPRKVDFRTSDRSHGFLSVQGSYDSWRISILSSGGEAYQNIPMLEVSPPNDLCGLIDSILPSASHRPTAHTELGERSYGRRISSLIWAATPLRSPLWCGKNSL